MHIVCLYFSKLPVLLLLVVFVRSCISDKPGILTDIDGNRYHTVKIGTQVWMAENLRVTRYRNGKPLVLLSGNKEWSQTVDGAYCCYNNDTSRIREYGLLYNWYAIANVQQIAPKGWHIPAIDEIKELVSCLGGDTIAGAKLKGTRCGFWLNQGTDTLSGSRFYALPGGYRYCDGTFHTLGSNGYWWTTTESYEIFAWSSRIFNNFVNIGRDDRAKNYGLSVRCIKD